MNVAVTEPKYRNKIHPKKFALWAGIASILMMFTALMSAYVVRQAQGNWLEFRIPDIFLYSTGVILLSSLTLHLSYRAFMNGKARAYRTNLILTFVLGIAFVVTQYQGWLHLQSIGIELTGNPSGSFLYVLSGLHAAHVLGGIGALTVALVHAFKLTYKVTAIRKLRLELTMLYWHFVDILWIYLIVFLILQQ